MKNHYHTSVEHLLLTAVGVALVFHVGRLAAGKMVTNNSPFVSKLGGALGGFFTFGAPS